MFKDKLKELRKKKEISQEKLASEIFVSRSAVAKWEQGRGVPSKESLELLCKYFEIDENELLDKNEAIDLCNNIQEINNKKNIIKNAILISLSIIIVILLIMNNNKTNNGYTYSNVLKNYEIKSVGLEINEVYNTDVNYILRNTGFYYDNYEIIDTEYYEYNEKTNVLIPKKTGAYYVGIKLTSEKKKTIINASILKIYCYDKKELIQINNVEDLYKINDNSDGQYILNNNINLEKISDFKPICSISNNFTGVFINPYNFVIKNLNINITETSDQSKSKFYSCGLFSSISNAYIDNIIIENVNIKASDNKDITTCVGGLSGSSNNSLITNCKITGKVSGNYYIGGLIGNCSFSTITNCIFNGEVEHKKNNKDVIGAAGGLFGELYLNLDNQASTCTIEDNIVNANIKSDYVCGKLTGYIRGTGYRNNVLNCIVDGFENYEIGKKK